MGTLLALLCVIAAGPAQDGTPVEARKAQAVVWQKKADQLFSQGKYQQALEAAQRSYQLYPTARTAYNVALIDLQLGQRETAFEQCIAALNLGPSESDRHLIEATLAELGPRLEPPRGWLHIVAEPAPAEVTLTATTDGYHPSPHTFGAKAGRQVVRARRAGYQQVDRAVEVIAGVRTEFVIQLPIEAPIAAAPSVLVEAAAPPPVAAPAERTPAVPQPVAPAVEPPEPGRPLLWIGSGMAGGGLLATAILGGSWVVVDGMFGASAAPWSERQWLAWAALGLCGTSVASSLVAVGGGALAALALLVGE